MVLFLHQTTTPSTDRQASGVLFMVLFLHQTTTHAPDGYYFGSCLWSYSYIKPQPSADEAKGANVVYGPIPTSNHNNETPLLNDPMLFMVLFLHQTTTITFHAAKFARLFMVLFLHQTTTYSCVCSFHVLLFMVLFLHQTTTLCNVKQWNIVLFMVLFLHQTTTPINNKYSGRMLFMVLFLHQTTTNCFIFS